MRAMKSPPTRRWNRPILKLVAGATLLALIGAAALAVAGAWPGAARAGGVAAVPGAAYAWGLNTSGQLGDGATANRASPVAVSLPAGVTIAAISGGAAHTLALSANGTVYAWGANNAGQLGNGTTVASATPVRVSLPAGVTATAVAAAGSFSLALTSAGAVYAWGSNQLGHLGNGTDVAYAATPVPVSVPAGVRVTAVADGGGHSLALTSAGAVYAWGDSYSGQLGNGLGEDDYDNACNTPNDDGSNAFFSDTPVASHLPAGVTATSIAAGACDSLALSADGTVYAWGDATYGELGNGATATFVATPMAVSLPSGVRAAAVMAGDFHAAFIQTELEGVAQPTTTTDLQGPNSGGQTFALTIPPGAVVNATTFTGNQVAPSTLPALPPGATLVGLPESFHAVDTVTNDSIDHFGAYLTLTFGFPPSFGAAAAGPRASGAGTKMTIATVSGSTWHTIASSTIPICCAITGSIDHFSVYAVLMMPAPAGIEGAVQRFFAAGDITGKGIENELLANLRAAAAARRAGGCPVVAYEYQAFINTVRAQTGKHIDTKAANTLIPEARFLIAHCG